MHGLESKERNDIRANWDDDDTGDLGGMTAADGSDQLFRDDTVDGSNSHIDYCVKETTKFRSPDAKCKA